MNKIDKVNVALVLATKLIKAKGEVFLSDKETQNIAHQAVKMTNIMETNLK